MRGVLVTGVLIALLLAAGGAAAQGSRAAALAGGNPFAAAKLFVDPHSPARRQADAWSATRPADAALLEQIASRPVTTYLTGGTSEARIQAAVRSRVLQIKAAGALPVFVASNIPDGCGKTRAPSRRLQAAYQRWTFRLTRGIGTAKAVVILEPNALANLSCLPPGRQGIRLALLRYAVRTLSIKPGISVYLDAGHSRWRPAAEMALNLRRVGLARIRGFALNISNYQSTPNEIAYGTTISKRLRGKRFIIDTSRNGLGAPPVVGRPRPANTWCNLPGRALGAAPLSKPASPLVDAYLWVKYPGESDGTCNGGPPAGHWWAEYALGLASRAAHSLSAR